MNFSLLLVCAVLCCVLCTSALPIVSRNTSEEENALSKYNIDINSITVSGVSSGAAFAHQFQVAYSKSVSGCGIIAGPPYWCANLNIEAALTLCSKGPGDPSVTELIAATAYAESLLSIDATKHLAQTRQWLVSGEQDDVVRPSVMDATHRFLKHYVDDRAISYNSVANASHSWLSPNYGNDCGVSAVPWIANCGRDYPGEMMQWLYEDKLSPPSNMVNDHLTTFAQTSYAPLNKPAAISMADSGYIYVPEACNDRTTQCKLHISFHGCQMASDDIGDVFAVHSSLNEWAETNNIIILYPQAKRSQVIPYNPKECWDWWGYTGPEYATKIAPQISTIKNMINALTGNWR